MSACPRGSQTKLAPNSVNYSFEGTFWYQVLDARNSVKKLEIKDGSKLPPHAACIVQDNFTYRVTFLSPDPPTFAQSLGVSARVIPSNHSTPLLGPRDLSSKELQMLKVTRSLLMFAVGVGAAFPILASAQPNNAAGAVFVMSNTADKTSYRLRTQRQRHPWR